MISRVVTGLVAAATVAGLIAYGLMAHRFSIVDDRSAGSYLFAIVSIFGVLGLTALLNRAWFSLLGLIIAGLVFGWWFSHHAQLSTTWIYLIQHAGAHGSLAVLFGSSLIGDRQPLVTRMAGLIHGHADARRDRYTRQVTWAWTIYFALTCVLSLALFLTDHMLAWSWLANILPIPLLISMFIIEFAIRRHRLPASESGGLTDGWRAYQRLRAEDSQRGDRP